MIWAGQIWGWLVLPLENEVHKINIIFLNFQYCYYIKRWGCNPAASHQIDESSQKGNVETPSTNSGQINDNQSQDSHIILVHSSDTSYTLSDTLIFLNKSIPDNNDNGTIDSEIVQILGHKLGPEYKTMIF